MKTSRHLTTRRGFIAAAGFGGVSLYGLWAAYGAAPNPFTPIVDAETPTEDAVAMANEAMAGPGGVGMAADLDAFRGEVARFVELYGQDDGSVYPRRSAAVTDGHDAQMPGMHGSGNDMLAPTDGHASGEGGHKPGSHDAPEPVQVLLLAESWYFEPGTLRLDRETAYRFRMMTADVTHGASIQFGRAARMIRLGSGAIVELELTFTEPGGYLVYCTSYCGAGHDGMQARIIVA